MRKQTKKRQKSDANRNEKYWLEHWSPEPASWPTSSYVWRTTADVGIRRCLNTEIISINAEYMWIVYIRRKMVARRGWDHFLCDALLRNNSSLRYLEMYMVFLTIYFWTCTASNARTQDTTHHVHRIMPRKERIRGNCTMNGEPSIHYMCSCGRISFSGKTTNYDNGKWQNTLASAQCAMHHKHTSAHFLSTQKIIK